MNISCYCMKIRTTKNFIKEIINEGLKNGCLCIYASVDIDN